MKKIISVVLFIITCSVQAGEMSPESVKTAGWNNLTEAQQAEILKSVADTVSNNKTSAQHVNTEIVDPKQIDQWVGLGEHIGQAFGGAAKELNIAVNDFIQTPVGMMTMGLILWHFVGSVLMHLFGSLLLLLVGFGFIRWHYNSTTEYNCTYNPEKTDWFGRSRLLTVHRECTDDDWKFGYCMCAIFTIMVSFIILFTY